MPLVSEDDDLTELILTATENQGISIRDGDVLVIAQSVVSKSEGNIINLEGIKPSDRAKEIAGKIKKEPREVEVILQQAQEILKLKHVLITQTKHGFICANSGVDSSNTEPGKVTILPEDPDETAKSIREKIRELTGTETAIIISDSQGRPFRRGSVGLALGVAGMKPITSYQGKPDLYEKKLRRTEVATADALATVGSIVMGESKEGTPAVIIRGFEYTQGEGSAQELLRPQEKDLFR